MSETIKIIDAEGYSIEARDNWGGIDEAKEKLTQNPQESVIFIAINDTAERQECVELTIAQTEKLIKGLQTLVKVLKE